MLLGAGVLWSLSGALIKLAYDQGRGPSGVSIAFYRSLVAGLVLLPMARRRFHTLRPKPLPPIDRTADSIEVGQGLWNRVRHSIRPPVMWCIVFFATMSICFVVASVKTEAANAIILQYTSTLWVFVLSPLLLHERARREDYWILAVAATGVIIIFVGNARTDVVGLIIALGAGLSFGLLTLMIRLLRDADSAAIVVVNMLGSAIVLLPAVLLFGELSMSLRSWLLIIALGVVQYAAPYYLYTLGLARVPAHQASLLTLIEPVLVPVWAYLAVGEIVPPLTLIGGSLILVSLLLFLEAARRSRRRTQTAQLVVGEATEKVG